MNCPAEVAYFYGVFMQENVLRLEIAMQDVIRVHILHGCTDLSDPFFYSLLWHLTSLFQVLVKILPQTRLKDQIGRIIIHKKVVQFDDMGMIEETLDLDFSD